MKIPLEKSVSQSVTSWRHTLFKPPEGGGIFSAGTLDFSPGWFQQNKEVCMS